MSNDPARHLRAGLCSVTLRHLPAEEVLHRAAEAGLAAIEWGADVHAPPQDPDRLSTIAEAGRAAGVAVASYGTYWRAASTPFEELEPLLRGAQALGCDRLRIWAGTTGSADANPAVVAEVVAQVRAAADRATELGLHLAFEHHDGTLADTPEATLDLLERVDHAGVGTYWQPRVGEDADTALAGLDRLLPHLDGVHAFSWWPGQERHPLTERTELWTGAIELLRRADRPIDLLLEFLPGDDAELLPREAATLRRWIDGSRPGAS